ncbi:hypothetical protein [Glycomyces tenuis]|uniref:hypothetical protein n=1 Tax=Glycomyces tenuis TaxID=58116 RepID=UPI0003FC8BF5|nr:hypothetical protein [Glycomyces tenuis]
MGNTREELTRTDTRKRSALAALLAFLVTAGMLALTPAAAQAEADLDAEHCVLNIDTGDYRCAETQADALAATSVGTQQEYVMAVVFDWVDHNWDAGTLALTSFSPSCTDSHNPPNEFFMKELDEKYSEDGKDWNNRISSVITYGGCEIRFYDDLHLDGNYSRWIDDSRNLSANLTNSWNNRAGSLMLS